jgi:hypothetical protein
MDNLTQNVLGRIACERLNIETLEERRSDRLDFHDVSVVAVRAALIDAHAAGRRCGFAQAMGVYCAIHNPDVRHFPWQLFCDDGRCVLVSHDHNDQTTVASEFRAADDEPHRVALECVPDAVLLPAHRQLVGVG